MNSTDDCAFISSFIQRTGDCYRYQSNRSGKGLRRFLQIAASYWRRKSHHVTAQVFEIFVNFCWFCLICSGIFADFQLCNSYKQGHVLNFQFIYQLKQIGPHYIEQNKIYPSIITGWKTITNYIYYFIASMFFMSSFNYSIIEKKLLNHIFHP